MSVILGVGITAVVAVAVFFAMSAVQDGGSYLKDSKESVNTGAADKGTALPAGIEPELVLLYTYDGAGAGGSGGAESEASSAQVSLGTLVGSGSPFLGDPSAPVTLVEFGDYQCHFCNVFFHDTKGLILENYITSGKVRMIFKDFHIVGPDSVDASHATHCAGDQGMFWEYHDILYANWAGENTGWASYENLASFASDIPGIDPDAWEQCMTDKPHSQKILQSNNDARLLGLTGTPSFFVIGPDGQASTIIGAEPYEKFAGVLDATLAAP